MKKTIIATLALFARIAIGTLALSLAAPVSASDSCITVDYQSIDGIYSENIVNSDFVLARFTNNCTEDIGILWCHNRQPDSGRNYWCGNTGDENRPYYKRWFQILLKGESWETDPSSRSLGVSFAYCGILDGYQMQQQIINAFDTMEYGEFESFRFKLRHKIFSKVHADGTVVCAWENN